MKNKIIESCFAFLALFLFACGFAAAVFIGMMLMPVAFVSVFVLAIREIIMWKRKMPLIENNKADKDRSVGIQRQATIRHIFTVQKNEHVA
jgi:hypothetical protein